MASGSRSINAGSDDVGSDSINLGSDQIFQNNCNVCLTQGNTREAVSYCTVCNGYLCQRCEYSHKGSRATKGHTLLTGSSIPSGSTKKKKTVPIMFCDIHKISLLEIYCKTHDDVICSICKMGSHTECDTVDVSRHASKENVAGTFRTAVKNLKDMQGKFTNLQKSRQLDKKTMVAQIQTCLQDVRQIRHDVNAKLDRLENKMAAEIKNLEDKLSKEIDGHDAMSKHILYQINDLQKSLDECQKTQTDDVIFIGAKKASSRKIEFEKIIGSLMAEIYPIEIRIEPNEILNDVIDQLQTLGTLVTGEQSRPSRSVVTGDSNLAGHNTQTRPSRSVPTVDSNMTGRDARTRPNRSVVTADSNLAGHNTQTRPSRSVPTVDSNITGHDARTRPITSPYISVQPSLLKMNVVYKQEEIDLGSRNVWGCTFMPDGHLVVACGGCLKLYGKGIKYISKLSVTSFDVACINESEVIVTQGENKQLQRVQVLPTMKVKNTMKMDKSCWDVDVFDNLIYTTCYEWGLNNGEIRVLDMGGNTQRRIGVDNNILMFKRPYSVKVSRDGSKLFVSDLSTNLVTCLNQQGRVIYQYSNEDLKGPHGLYVDGEDNLLVCGRDSHNVHVVRHDGKQEKMLLSEKDGMKYPKGISYRQSDGCLAVVMGIGETKLTVFTTKI